jgi:SAM-dependent MidA family methyltransferase
MREFSKLPPSWQNLSVALSEHIQKTIQRAGGWLPFDAFMHLALYQPEWGYYSNGLNKIGQHGDFVTAPEISPLFAQCLANQVAELLTAHAHTDILEIGAGRGTLAIDLMLHLQNSHSCPPYYFILETSAHLQAVQKAQFEARAPELLSQVSWIHQLPEDFRGIMLANEVLDAMPVRCYQAQQGHLQERGVGWCDTRQAFIWVDRAVEADNPAHLEALNAFKHSGAVALSDYRFEWNPLAEPWLNSLYHSLTSGALLLIDYGQEAKSYFHPHRTQGQLACYFQHTKDEDPLQWPGLKDITAQVNFSAVANAATQIGFELAGFTTQANFLIGCGLGELCAEMPEEDLARFKLAQAIKTLTLPDEMGETFKVLGLTKNLSPMRWRGFGLRDLTHLL